MKYAMLSAIALVFLPAVANAQVSATVTVGTQGTVNAQQQQVPPPPPVYVQPAPQYAPQYAQQPVYAPAPTYQPMYVQQRPYGYRMRRRMVMDYNGGPIPQGSVLRTRRMLGLAIPGVVVFAGFYLSSVLGAAVCTGNIGCNPAAEWLFLPVAGPFIMLTTNMNGGDRALAVFDGVFQAAGFIAMVIGFASSHQELVMYGNNEERPRRTRPEWAVIPAAPGAQAGLSLAVSNF